MTAFYSKRTITGHYAIVRVGRIIPSVADIETKKMADFLTDALNKGWPVDEPKPKSNGERVALAAELYGGERKDAEIDPGEGYRLRAPGDNVTESDEVWIDGTWQLPGLREIGTIISEKGWIKWVRHKIEPEKEQADE